MRRSFRRLVAVVSVITITGMLTVIQPGASIAAPSPQSASVEVRITEFAFTPQTVTITSGQSVSWVNAGSIAHNITPERTDYDGGWNALTVQPGFIVDRPFSTPGTYNYYDANYRDQGMTGVVVVQPQPNQQQTATPTATATPAPTNTSVPGQPTNTAVPGQPTNTPVPGQPTGTPSFTIVSPTEGQVFTVPTVDVRIQSQNITLRPVGQPNRPGEGHFSLFLDNLPEVIVSDPNYQFQNVAPGNHTLRVELRQNDNTPFTPPIQATSNFVVRLANQPTTPPVVTAIATTIPGQPTPTIGLPRTGDGSYTPPGGPPGWLLIAGPLAAFFGVLLFRGRRVA